MADHRPSSRNTRRNSQLNRHSLFTLPLLPPLSPICSSYTLGGETTGQNINESIRLPSARDILAAPSDMNSSVQLAPLRNVARSTTPLLRFSGTARSPAKPIGEQMIFRDCSITV